MGALTFLFPAFAWAAILAAPVVAMYFLKSRPRRTPVSSNRLWRIVLDRLKPNSFFQRFQNSLFLLLQLAVIAWAVLAMTRPIFGSGTGLTRLVIIDASASMQAADLPPSRFELARVRARELIVGWNGRAGLYVLTDRLRSLATPGEEKGLACAALGRLVPTHTATPHRDKVLRMLRDLEGVGADEIFVLTDTLDLDIPRDFLPQTELHVEIFGAAQHNVAITGVETLWDPVAKRLTGSLLVENLNPVNVEVEISLESSGSSPLPMKVSLSPWIRSSVDIPPLPVPLTCRLRAPTDRNISAADDVWYLSDPGLRPRVWINAPAGSVLFRLQRSLPLVEFVASPGNAGLETVAGISVGTPPPAFQDLPGAVFEPGPEGIASGEILDWDRDHPLLRYVNWDAAPPEALMPQSFQGLSLVDTVRGSLVCEQTDLRGERRIPHLWLALDPDDKRLRNDLFLPVLLYNLVEYLLQDNFPRMSYPVGHPGLVALTKGTGPTTAGFHPTPGHPDRVLAVNLSAPSEAHLKPAPSRLPTQAQKLGRRLKDEASSPWQGLLSIAFVCVLAEWYLYMRRY